MNDTLRRSTCFAALSASLLGLVCAPAARGAERAPALSPIDGEALRGNWQELRDRGLRLLPVPKRIQFADAPIALAGENARRAVIVLTADTESARIAAAEIVSRLQDFSISGELPVVPVPRQDAYNIVIESTWPNTFTRDEGRHPEARKTEQAYGLYPRPNSIVLAGQGEVGMLYAAVTLRWLIEEQDGKVLLHSAAVTDWPDYKHRHVGTFLAPYQTRTVGSDPEAHLANMRKYVDWLFRMKATGTFRHSISSQRHTSLVDTIASTPEARACARIVNEYSRKRGIVTMHNGSVKLGSYPEDKDRPGFDQMMKDRNRGHYHSWARHDLHRNKARNMAGFCRESGFDLAFIHAVDSGGILDPELWSKRDALTREKYGNDRVQADADMFNIYAEEFAKAGASTVFVAYPYTASYLNEDFVLQQLGMPDTAAGRARAGELVADVDDWMNGINRKLARGVRMCIREARRRDMFRFYAGYPGRPMWIYWELTHYRNSIYPILSTNVRCMGAGYSPDRPREDILWANDIDYLWFSEPLRVAACEYAWNTRFPGSKPYDPAYMAGGEAEVDSQEDLDIVAERAAVGLWGVEGGEFMRKVLASHLSWRVAVDPKKMTERLPADVMPRLIRKNHTAVRQSCEAMDSLWEKVKQAKGTQRNLMDGFSYPYFVQFYSMAKAAAVYTNVHLREAQAREAIRSGNMPLAVREIALAREELGVNRIAYEKAAGELAEEPWVIRYEALPTSWRTRRLETKLLHPDFAGLSRRLDELEQSKDKLYEEYNIPDWFRQGFPKRGLTAVKTEAGVELDGELAETAWATSPPVDQFVGHRQFKVMSVPGEARLLYDAKHLYLGARLIQPLIEDIKEPSHSVDTYVFTEQVELLFLTGDTAEADLYQLTVDTAGNIFSMRKVAVPEENTRKTEEGWPSGAKAAVRRTPTGWSFEMAIPLESLGNPPLGRWRAVLARDLIVSVEPRQVETFASAFFEGRSYHTAKLYSPLRFSSSPSQNVESAPGLHVTKATMARRTTQRGAGTEVSFAVSLETRHPLRQVVVDAEILDREHQTVGKRKVLEKDAVALRCAMPRPVSLQLENEHEGLTLRVNLTYRTLTGELRSVTRTVVLGDLAVAIRPGDRFVPGVVEGTRAVAVPVRLPGDVRGKKLLSFERGTVEFWIRPNVDMAVLPEQWGERFLYLFHYGPQVRKGATSPGRNSLTICHEKKGWISFSFHSPDGDRRLVHSKLPNWKAGEWHHIACVWDLSSGEQSKLALYLDGRRSSGFQHGRKGGIQDLTPMSMNEGAYAGQLGSLNSGLRRAEAAFDELRICNVPRYDKDFIPQRSGDAQGLLHFRFENDLTGYCRLDGAEATVAAAAGASAQ